MILKQLIKNYNNSNDVNHTITIDKECDHDIDTAINKMKRHSLLQFINKIIGDIIQHYYNHSNKMGHGCHSSSVTTVCNVFMHDINVHVQHCT